MFLSVLSSCHFWASLTDDLDPHVTLSFDKTSSTVAIGGMDYIQLELSDSQSSSTVTWSYDDSVVFAKTDNYGAVVTGLSSGSSTIKATCNGSSATCLVTVTTESYAATIANPYVYASVDYVDVKPSEKIRVSAALFGGTSADTSGFTWSVDKPSIASIAYEGNYCWISGVSSGIARVQVRHNKSAYPYSIIVNCSSDGTSVSYITTSSNIVTINLSEKSDSDFSVSLKNCSSSDYASGFTYSVVDSLGNEISDPPVSIADAGLGICSLTASKAGVCYVRCKHPLASYDLDVLVRVVEDAETAYIEPSSSIVTVSGGASETVNLELLNYKGDVDSSLFSWSFSENAADYISYEVFNGSSNSTGDSIRISGVKTGSVKITVSYPDVESRSIIVLVRDIESEASSASTYITTDQNFMVLEPGGSAAQINVVLKNCEAGDISNLGWSITNCPSDGSSSNVIEWSGGDGTSTSSIGSSRAASLDYSESAYCVVTPLNPGKAYIDVSHPKSIYTTRISIVVKASAAADSLSSHLSPTGSPLIYIANGGSATAKISFSGDGASDDVAWASGDGAAFSISGSGAECSITAPASGAGLSKSTLTASHKYSLYPVCFTVVCYDTEEELSSLSLSAIYSEKTYDAVDIGSTIYLSVSYSSTDQSSSPDISWACTSGKDSIVGVASGSSSSELAVTGLAAGDAVIEASCAGCQPVDFVVHVSTPDVIDENEPCYLTTSDNVVYFSAVNEAHDVNVTLYNIAAAGADGLAWACSDTSAFEVASNGASATITSLSVDSAATLTVTHPLSSNSLVIYLKSGSEYEYVNKDSCYISTDSDTLKLYAGQNEVSLVATLNHTAENDAEAVSKGFTFSSDDTSIAEVSYVQNTNLCYVKPVASGTAKITVHHDDADFDKEVIVVVNKAENSDDIPYISTESNVITIVQGEFTPASVNLVNSDLIGNSYWTWTSTNTSIADVVANNGTTAMLSGNSAGTAEITVKHSGCLYPISLIVIVLDSSVITSRPYISVSDNILTLQKGGSKTITAEMIGGSSDSDTMYFNWAGSSSSLILINGTNNSCYVRGVSTGMAYVTCKNSRYPDSYSKTILVIVEDSQKDGVYISPSNKIIKLSPDSTGLTTVSATLVNGGETDGEDFIWWADDYKLISITPVAEQCSIIPTGRTGTTYIHIKHEKAAAVCDILVMVSDYDKFAFSSASATLTAGTLNFYPLQVPAVEEDYDIVYSSSNTDVCIVDGSNSVAFVCGQGYGTASLTATMKATDGTEMAVAEMLVTVSVADVSKPVVSLGQDIITMEAGTSRTFSASISGEGLDDNAAYTLKWTRSAGKGISILDESADLSAYGSECYITANLGGEYVLTVTHPSSGASASMYVIVEEKGEVSMELDSYYEEVYMDDGSFSLTATLSNASDSDYGNIAWSAIKVGGSNIVSVSKTNGSKCTVTPKAIGQTSVIAKLPDGTMAKCVVVVKAAVQITLSTGAVHVIPGYTEYVPYTTTPSNLTLTPVVQFSDYSSSTEYFSVENDSANKRLVVKGLVDYPSGAAGTVTIIMVGASSSNAPKLTVYVKYDIELSLLDMSGNNLTKVSNSAPDTANVKSFKVMYYPVDTEITVDCGGAADVEDGPLVSVGTKSVSTVLDNGVEKGLMTVTLVPHSEGERPVVVKAQLPSDSSGAYAKKAEFYYSAYYSSYSIVANFDSTPAGSFTNYSNGVLTLYDGEESVFYVKIANENAAGSIDYGGITFENNTGKKEFGLTTDSVLLNYDDTKIEKDRQSIKNKIFSMTNSDSTYTDVTSLYSNVPLLYLAQDSTVGSTEKYFRFKHCFDYYKEVKSEGVYDGSCLANNDADYYLVTKDLVCYNGGVIYYSIKKPSIPNGNMLGSFNAYTMQQHTTKDSGNIFVSDAKVLYDKFYFNLLPYGTSLKEIYTACTSENGYAYQVFSGLNGINVYSYTSYEGMSGSIVLNPSSCSNNIGYIICSPYVISKNELSNNPILNMKLNSFRQYSIENKIVDSHQVLVTGDHVPSDTYTTVYSYDWINTGAYSYIPALSYNIGDNKFLWITTTEGADNTLFFNTPMQNNYITPTVSKDFSDRIASSVNSKSSYLKIPITRGDGTTEYKTIVVKFNRKWCKAYTNDDWTTESVTYPNGTSYTHYVLK